MNYAYLFAGIALGSLGPWILMLAILRNKDAQQSSGHITRLQSANELLTERNEIGEREARALSGINASLALMTQESAMTVLEAKADRRERIATRALQGYLAGRIHDNPDKGMPTGHHQYVAESCLRYTDALIAQLDGETNSENEALNALHVIRTVATEPHHPNALETIRQIAEREIVGVPRKGEA